MSDPNPPSDPSGAPEGTPPANPYGPPQGQPANPGPNPYGPPQGQPPYADPNPYGPPQGQPPYPGPNPYGPPQGQPPYGQQPPAYGAAGAHQYGAPGGPYVPPQQKTSNAALWVLLGIGLVLLLTCGGCLALGGMLASETKKAIEETTSVPAPAVPDASSTGPLEVSEGQAFSFGGVDYQQGWSVEIGELGGDIVDLRGRESEEGELVSGLVQIYFHFVKDGQVLGSSECVVSARHATGPATCWNTYDGVDGYDTITVTTE